MQKNHRTQWFTSDWHIGHPNILTFCKNRRFETIEEMRETYIANHNKVVGDNDIVWFLGDMFMHASDKEQRDTVSRLRGIKILVRGNHDRDPKLSFGWTAILDSAEIRIGKHHLMLSHYYFLPPWWKRIYLRLIGKGNRFSKCIKDNGRLILHGHTHDSEAYNPKYPKNIHIGVDAWNGKLVHESDIIKIIQKHNLYKIAKVF